MMVLSSPEYFFQRWKARNSKVYRRMWQEFKLVQDFIAVLVTCKFDDNLKKNEGTIVSTTLTPL